MRERIPTSGHSALVKNVFKQFLALQAVWRPLAPAARMDHNLLPAATVPIWMLSLSANKMYIGRAV